MSLRGSRNIRLKRTETSFSHTLQCLLFGWMRETARGVRESCLKAGGRDQGTEVRGQRKNGFAILSGFCGFGDPEDEEADDRSHEDEADDEAVVVAEHDGAAGLDVRLLNAVNAGVSEIEGGSFARNQLE